MSSNRNNSRRQFSAATKRLAWARCGHRCQGCGATVTGAGDIVYDHVIPWELTRDSTPDNCQILCLTCDRQKTFTRDLPAIAESNRKRDFHLGISGPGRGKHPMPCGRNSRLTKTFHDGVRPRRSHAEKHQAFLKRRYGGQTV